MKPYKIQFWSWFFIKLESLTKLHFFCSFSRLVVVQKWTWKKGAFDSRGFKKYFQRAEGSEKLILLSNSISTYSFLKTRFLFSKKKLKVWHFLLKKCYFRIQKARFWKGMFGDTISQQNQFLRTFSSLEIFFEAPRIKCAFFSCPFMPHYELWKIAEKLQFC